MRRGASGIGVDVDIGPSFSNDSAYISLDLDFDDNTPSFDPHEAAPGRVEVSFWLDLADFDELVEVLKNAKTKAEAEIHERG